jgi:glycosyltransferase involved in cell wall biosynthesis
MFAMVRAMSDITPTEVIHAMDLFALPAAAKLARSVKESESQEVSESGSDTAHRSPLTAHRSPITVLYDARELYSSLGPLEGKGLRQRFITAMERRYVRKYVDHVTVSGPLDAEIIQQDLGLHRMPTVIMNVPPYQEPIVSDRLRERCGISSDAPVAVYQGVVLPGRGLRPCISALRHLPDVHLCILGEGPARADMLAHAERMQVQDRVHMVGAVPYDELHAWTCSADVGLCCIEPISRSYELALPNKLFEYVMARIPVVVSDMPAMRDVVVSARIGVLVSAALEPLPLAQSIRQALVMRGTPEFRQAADDAAKRYCYEQQRDAVREAYS